MADKNYEMTIAQLLEELSKVSSARAVNPLGTSVDRVTIAIYTVGTALVERLEAIETAIKTNGEPELSSRA